MKAFVQRFECGEHLLVRAGPDATEFGRPWLLQCLGKIDGSSVTLMAFEHPSKGLWLKILHWLKRIVGVRLAAVFLMPAYVKASAKAILSDPDFTEVNFDRLGDAERQIAITLNEKGNLSMAVKKEALHDIAEIFKADGTLNVLGGIAGLVHFLGQNAAGHANVSHGKVTKTPKPDGSNDIVISFNQK